MKKGLFAVLLLLIFGGASVARADLVTFTGVNGSGQSVSGEANFSLSGTTLTITLTNLGTVNDAGQLLTDLFFTASTGTLGSQTGDLINISSTGAVTDLGSSTLGWGFGSATVNSISGFELCVICQGGVSASATPSEGIIGPGPYTTANSSIKGNAPHNPFVNQTATFVINGVTGLDLGEVIFSWGTTPGDNTPVTTPEPASLGLLGAGLAGLGIKLRRRSKKA